MMPARDEGRDQAGSSQERLASIVCFGLAGFDFDRFGGAGTDRANRPVFGEEARHVALSFADPLDLDRDRVHPLLESGESFGELRWKRRDGRNATPPDAPCERDAEREQHDHYEHPAEDENLFRRSLPSWLSPFNYRARNGGLSRDA